MNSSNEMNRNAVLTHSTKSPFKSHSIEIYKGPKMNFFGGNSMNCLISKYKILKMNLEAMHKMLNNMNRNVVLTHSIKTTHSIKFHFRQAHIEIHLKEIPQMNLEAIQ